MVEDGEQELARRGHRLARYGDDFLLVVKSRRAGDRRKASLTRFLQRHLKLEIHETKSRGGATTEGTFLGFTFHGTRSYWSHAALPDFRSRLPKLTGRSWGVSMAHRVRRLTASIRGGRHYYGLSPYDRPVPALAAWLRRRRRMCLWTQGRSVRTKGRERLKLGTARKTALLTALSRKGLWPLSRTRATQTGMTTQGISDTLGLVSIRALWLSLPSPACTASCGPAGEVVWGLGRATSLATRLGPTAPIGR